MLKPPGTGKRCQGAQSSPRSGASVLPAAGFGPADLAIITVGQQELAYLTLGDGSETVVMRSDDRGLSWQEMVSTPPNTPLSGTGSRMAVAVPRDTTFYYD